jgi:hypothetical protein
VTSPPLPEEWHACQLCSRVLEALRDADTGELIWDHTAMDRADGVNHAAVPVPYSALGRPPRTRCDFCGEYDPAWALPVADFSMVNRLGPGRDWGSTEDWLACADCADLLSREQWPALTRRAAEASARRDRVPVDIKLAELKPLYRQVRRHQRGGVRLVAPLTALVDTGARPSRRSTIPRGRWSWRAVSTPGSTARSGGAARLGGRAW